MYAFVKAAGFLYLLTMATCTIAGRKHYTVDVALAVVIAGLTFFRFQVGAVWREENAYRDRQAKILFKAGQESITGNLDV